MLARVQPYASQLSWLHCGSGYFPLGVASAFALKANMCLDAAQHLAQMLIASCCRQALKAYPTSIDGDLALLRDAEPGSRQHKAVAVSPVLAAGYEPGRLLLPWLCRAGLS